MKLIYQKTKKTLTLMAAIMLLMTSQLHAQFIPIDSAFADLLSASGMGSCVSNYKLDTIRAQADSNTHIWLEPSAAYPRSYSATNLNGLEYFTFRNSVHPWKILTIVNCPNLVSMPARLPNLYVDLDIGNCPLLSNIAVFGDTMTSFRCTHTNISVLPVLPPLLWELQMTSCPLNSLPVLPASLEQLYIDSDQFASLPPLPSGLRVLSVSHNRLTTLPAVLPTSLASLMLNTNNLTSLPFLPAGLIQLDIANNHISHLPALPHGLDYLAISNNPIACLPLLPDTLTGFLADQTFITCIPNKPHFLQTSFPICNDTDHTCPYGGVQGYIYWDRDDDCLRGATDRAFPSAVVSVDHGVRYVMTDPSGFYRVGLDSGTHTLEPVFDTLLFAAQCVPGFTAYYNGWDTIRNADFALGTHRLCSNMNVDISTAFQRFCRNDNTYTLTYINQGTDTAYNAYIDVKVPAEVTIISTSIPASVLGGSVHRFMLGSVAPFASGTISITDSVSCTSTVGQSVCLSANIYPRNACQPVSPLWDSSQISVERHYNAGADSVYFFVKNTGHDMTGSVALRLYEDELLQSIRQAQIHANDSVIIAVRANGHTYRVEADQRPDHPGRSAPRDFSELAGGPPYTVGYVASVPQDDADEWVEIDCHVVRASLDPNEKEVYPSGIGTHHYVTKEDALDYIIAFQNTGNDTAFLVVVVDTLDNVHLDPATFVSGSSSHPYKVYMEGAGVVKWYFSNILLPDSTTNEKLSHGFVKLKISQRAGNTPGTRINNVADIYFDANTPVRTPQSFVTVQTADVVFPNSVKDITSEAGYSVSAYPNPFADYVRFTITSDVQSNDSYHFEMIDMTGHRVMERNVSSAFEIERNAMATGVYLYRITRNGAEVGKGKIVAK